MHVHIIWIALISLLVPVFAQSEYKPLPETYVSEDERLTLRYPTGWNVWAEQPGLVIVSTSDEPMLVGTEDISTGEAAIIVLFSTSDNASVRDSFQGDNPTAVVEHFIETRFLPAIESAEFSSTQIMQFADFSAARIDGTFFNNSVFVIAVDRGNDAYSLIVGLTTIAELNKFEPKLLAIAESIRFQPSDN
jgi:hypothetical protein